MSIIIRLGDNFQPVIQAMTAKFQWWSPQIGSGVFNSLSKPTNDNNNSALRQGIAHDSQPILRGGAEGGRESRAFANVLLIIDNIDFEVEKPVEDSRPQQLLNSCRNLQRLRAERDD
jgi:hypothetical protein